MTQLAPSLSLRHLLGLVVACASLGALVAPAHAAAKDRVLLLQVDGAKALQPDRDALEDGIRAAFAAYPGLELVTAPEGDITDQMIELECFDLDDDCLGKLATRAGATRVIHGEASKKGRLLALKLRIVGADGSSSTEKSLEAKDNAALLPLISNAITDVFGPPPPVVAKGRLTVEVSAPNASIFLGSELIGTGSATLMLDAGEYTVRIAHPGSEEVIRKVTVAADDTTLERVTLVALPVAARPDKPSDDEASAAWVPWVLVGAAVIGGTVAAILLATGGDDDAVRGPALLGIDPAGAWRDPVTQGGRR